VSDALLEHRSRLPQPIKGKVEDLARLVSDLAALRGPAFYGYEREGIPASRAFTESYAKRGYRRVEEYVTEIKAADRCAAPVLARLKATPAQLLTPQGGREALIAGRH